MPTRSAICCITAQIDANLPAFSFVHGTRRFSFSFSFSFSFTFSFSFPLAFTLAFYLASSSPLPCRLLATPTATRGATPRSHP